MAAAPEDMPPDAAAQIRVATVASVDLAAARVTLRYGDPEGEEVETPPLRWLMPRSGATRSWSPPSEGEQGLLLCPEGDIGAGIFLPGMTRDSFPPAGSTAEEVVEYADGARIAYDPDAHVLTATLPGGSTANIAADQINITGNVAIDGNLTITGTASADVDVLGGGKSLKNHVHTGVQAGGANSGPPQ